MKKGLLVLGTLMLGIMGGCGNNNSMMSSDSSPAAIRGAVADGYLIGANVFLDKNGNYALDAGEPSTATDANGAYILQVDSADVGKYPIVAQVIKGVTVDKDTNQAVTGSYVLSMPKESVSGTVASNFISPISSQLRELMETGKYAKMQQAMDQLRTKLGLPAGTDILMDYMATKNQPMHTAAQNMAAMMGGQMMQLFNESGTTAKLDVNRYRGMMGGIFSNMSSLRSSEGKAHMTDFITTMTSALNEIVPGQPYRNMSSSYRGMGGMMASGSSMR